MTTLRYGWSVLFSLAYFCWLAHDGLWYRWAADDMMNMASYWTKGFWPLLKAQFFFWSTYYRPAGGLFYMPLFLAAGLDPFPYRLTIFLLLCANVLLLWWCAYLLTQRPDVATAATLLGCYHGNQIAIYYYTSMVYDILCFFFYLLALGLYIHFRRRGPLSPIHVAACCSLFICACNAKEMGVTLAVAFLAFEWLYYPPPGRDWRTARLTVLAACLYSLGKMYGPDSLVKLDAYRPVFTAGRFLGEWKAYVASILYFQDPIPRGTLYVFWAVLLLTAWGYRTPALRFAGLFLIFSTLPIAFIPFRAGPCLYIPVVGWAIYAATLYRDLLYALIDSARLRGLVSLVLFGVLAHHTADCKNMARDALVNGQNRTWWVIQELKRTVPRLPPHSRVIYIDDPFPDWDIVFISQLHFRDRTIHIDVRRRLEPPPSQSEIDAYDAILSFRDGKLIPLKLPKS